MGSGSTVAAAEAMKLSCVGIERNPDYYAMASKAVPILAHRRGVKDQLQLSLA